MAKEEVSLGLRQSSSQTPFTPSLSGSHPVPSAEGPVWLNHSDGVEGSVGCVPRPAVTAWQLRGGEQSAHPG